MALKFNVTGRIAKPVSEVFEAVVNPEHLSHFFTTGGAEGRLETGATVSWDFADFPGRFPVQVIEVVKDKRVVFEWASGEAMADPAKSPGDTRVTMNFEALEDGRTLVNITEEGWSESAAGMKAAFGNCEGWTGMLAAMKAWLEYSINLRQGFYK